MPYQPIVPEGQHLGTSHKVDGAVTGHLFEDGTNELKGHAAWQWVDEPEPDYSPSYEYEWSREPTPAEPRQLTPEERELAEKIAALIVAGTVRAVAAATPHMKRWWNEKAVPPVKSVWKRVTSPRRANSQAAAATSSSLSQATFVASATGVEVAVRESKISMGSAEWAQRFRAMLAAGAFKDEQLRILSSARIEDGDPLLETQSKMEQLTPQQFADRIKLMLEANPSLLDEETSAELTRVFSALSKPSNDPGLTQSMQ
ncbi:hypothetical protein [Arthrobacter sp. VKM Ac-2550]|uniref:hypothetical protein n=1 Tax=Crystallibacter permensis TaxID=1938888 RepID=UPI0022262A6F|nr:hypothetical protein [Arthrobacter sp. VKM Ac-2550]MCW2134522.1 hypothetical protein [Arthrobacter sp. VKM Ac-2550]